MKSPVIAILTTDEGHYSLALAIKSLLSPTYQVEIFKRHLFMHRLYQMVYRFFPSVFILPFKLGRHPSLIHITQYLTVFSYKKQIQRFFQQYHPDLVFNTYFMYLPSLRQLQAKQPLYICNVLTDPRSVHPILIAPPPIMNVAFDTTAAELCRGLQPGALIQANGWLVRPEFETAYSKADVRQQLGLKVDCLTILLSGGSEGSESVIHLLSHFPLVNRPVQIVVVCGSNRLLLSRIKLTSSQPAHNPLLTITAVGFVEAMYLYTQAADLVVGKAGPNSIFEAVATLTPFFAISHISGQEDGNLDVIRDYHLGYVEENIDKACELLDKIMTQPQVLAEFEPYLRHLAEYNKQAKPKLLSLVKDNLPQPHDS